MFKKFETDVIFGSKLFIAVVYTLSSLTDRATRRMYIEREQLVVLFCFCFYVGESQDLFYIIMGVHPDIKIDFRSISKSLVIFYNNLIIFVKL